MADEDKLKKEKNKSTFLITNAELNPFKGKKKLINNLFMLLRNVKVSRRRNTMSNMEEKISNVSTVRRKITREPTVISLRVG